MASSPRLENIEPILSSLPLPGQPKDHPVPHNDHKSDIQYLISQAELTPWLARTGWVYHLGGKEAHLLIRRSRPVQHDEPLLERLCLCIDQALNYCHTGAQPEHCPLDVRRLLCSVGSRRVGFGETLPFLNRPDATFQEYMTLWKRLFCYIIRSYNQPSKTGLLLSEQQVSRITQFEQHLSLGLSSGDLDLRVMSEELIALSAGLIEQPLTGWGHESPLIHFMVILAIDEESFTWVTLPQFRKTLDAVLFISRLILLEHSVPQTSRTLQSDFVLRFEQYHGEHLSSQSHSAVIQLVDLQAYCATLHHHTLPTTHGQKPLSPSHSSVLQTPKTPHSALSERQSTPEHPDWFPRSTNPSNRKRVRRTSPPSRPRAPPPCPRAPPSTQVDEPAPLPDLIRRSKPTTLALTRQGVPTSRPYASVSHPSAHTSTSLSLPPSQPLRPDVFLREPVNANMFSSAADPTSRSLPVNLLRWAFAKFQQDTPSPTCPVCWLVVGGSDTTKHRFTSYSVTAVDWNRMATFRKHNIRWMGNFHYGSGAPRFVCGGFKGPCPYGNILLPMLLAFYTPKYTSLLPQTLGADSTSNERAFGQALIQPSSLQLHGNMVTKAVYLFDVVLPARCDELDPFSGVDIL